ncbi:MAG: hypothetical protein NUV78_02270 [Candidatus Zambryskibacteria bacterium]|nr:hypothetical protein [Candidatus Zambryskibacteria bacterium]
MCSAVNGQPLQVGDQLKQEISHSLSGLAGIYYVTAVIGGEIEISKQLGGRPLTDDEGRARRFLGRDFLKLQSVAA